MPTANAGLDVRALFQAFSAEVGRGSPWRLHLDLAEFEAGRAILELPREHQVAVVRQSLAWQVERINGASVLSSYELEAILNALLRRKLPFTADDLEELVRTLSGIRRAGWWTTAGQAGILRAVEEHAATQGLTEPLRDVLRQLAVSLRAQQDYAAGRKLLQRVEALLEPPTDPAAGFRLTTDEAWTDRLRRALEEVDAARRSSWNALLSHCATANASKPTAKWLRLAQPLVESVGSPEFAAIVGAVLAEVGKPGGPRRINLGGFGFTDEPTLILDTHVDLLRGLVWCTSLAPDDELLGRVGDAALASFHKVPNIGPRAPKIGNACLHALASVSTTAAVAQLGRVKARAKHASVRNQLGKALGTAAEKSGLSADELEEVAVPTCGLTGVGEHQQQLGDVTAQVRVADGKAVVRWRRADGKVQTTVPAAVKAGFPEEVRALKQLEKEVARLLPAQRDRLERLFLEERSWALADFRARFLDHPLVGTLARRLIWRFREGDRQADGIWHEGRLVDARGQELAGLGAGTRVAPWHPLHAAGEEVEAWRDWLEAHEVRQPFKQAHREVYRLTDAERQTGVYSNRFAAHLLRQHQFSALCLARGWRYRLQGEWDSANTPTLTLPRWDLRAEFWVPPVWEGGPLLERADLSHMAVYLYVSTDQVRFYRGASAVPLPLDEVPPLVFSEVLRDVDLFVGVASVGNDPTWADGGLTGQYRDYWARYSFGELLPSAQTRKQVLERIVPRLRNADRCSFEGRFLVVRGDLRTYKIHLGSGNILMSPDDCYLCIVPVRGAAVGRDGKVYLPFEGDEVLSVILSKAFLLAEDTKITDPTIRNQIVPRERVLAGH
jgi:hypothetical protein